MLGEQRRDRIADLAPDCGHRLVLGELEVIPERHTSRALPQGDRPVLGGMEITTFFGLEELRPKRHGRPVPPEAAEDIRRTGRLGGLPTPTTRDQFSPT